MVEGLPPDGALARAVSGSPWGTAEYQGAKILDRLARMEINFVNANRPENASPAEYPEPEWRPGDPLPKAKAKASAKAARKARKGYQRIVAVATPQYAEEG